MLAQIKIIKLNDTVKSKNIFFLLFQNPQQGIDTAPRLKGNETT